MLSFHKSFFEYNAPPTDHRQQCKGQINLLNRKVRNGKTFCVVFFLLSKEIAFRLNFEGVSSFGRQTSRHFRSIIAVPFFKKSPTAVIISGTDRVTGLKIYVAPFINWMKRQRLACKIEHLRRFISRKIIFGRKWFLTDSFRKTCLAQDKV